MKKLLILSSVIGLIMASQISFADHRDYRNSGRQYNSGLSVNFNVADRSWPRYNSAYNPAWYKQRDWHRATNGRRAIPGNTWRNHNRYNRTSVFTGSSIGLGIGFDSWNSRNRYNSRPVVVYNRTVINTPAPPKVVSYYSESSTNNSAARRSLLKDRYGNCYERETDRYGNETRRELPASACNF